MMEPTAAELEGLLVPILERDASEQEGALEELCRQHPHCAQLLRSTYGTLLRYGLLEDSCADRVESEPAPKPPPASGEQFGSFRLVERLGKGAMGVVFRAEDGLGRCVALKVIHPDHLDSERARRRFQHEIAALARLDHPGLCPIYNAGEHDGCPFLVMRLIDGEPLDRQLAQARHDNRGAWGAKSSGGGSSSHNDPRPRPADLQPALQLVEQISRALHAAHEAGLVHRDVKPGNVMVQRDGTPVVMDFGLARAVDLSSDLTQSSEPIGTPAYMAPEQIRGEVADARTDVHALGCLLYECLTLRPPFTGRNREELYHSILAEEPIDVRRLQPAVSRGLAAVVHTALAKEKRRRYQSALALAEDLRAVLDGRPTAMKPPGPLARLCMVACRHRAISAVCAAVLIGLLTSLYFLTDSLAHQRRYQALMLIARAESVAEEDPELALAVLERALALSPEPEVQSRLQTLLPTVQPWDEVWVAEAPYEDVVRSPDGRFLLLESMSLPAVLLRRAADGRWSEWTELPWPTLHPHQQTAIFTEDGETLALWVLGRDGQHSGGALYRYALDGPRPERTTGPIPLPETFSMHLTAHGDRLLVTGIDVRSLNGSVPPTGMAWLLDCGTGDFVTSLPILCAEHTVGGDFLGAAGQRVVLPGVVLDRDGRSPRPFLTPQGRELAIHATAGRFALRWTKGVRVYTADGELLAERPLGPDHGAETLSLDWAPDGSRLVVGCTDGTVFQLDRDGGWGHRWTLPSGCWARFTPDGRRVVTSQSDGAVALWTLDGRLLAQLRAHHGVVRSVACDPDDGAIYTAGRDGLITCWRPDAPSPLHPLWRSDDCSQIQRSGEQLFAITEDGHATRLALDGPARSHRFPPRSLLFPHRDGRSVWVLTRDHKLRRWDGNGDPGAALDLGIPISWTPPDSLAQLDEHRVITALRFTGTSSWLCEPTEGTAAQRHSIGVESVAATPLGEFAALGAGPEGLLGIGVDGSAVLICADEPSADDSPMLLAVTADGRRAAVGSHYGWTAIWDVPQRKLLERPHDHPDMLRALAWSPSGEFVATASRRLLVVRRVGDPKPLLATRLRDQRIESLAFLDEKTILSAGGRRGGSRVWWLDSADLEAAVARLPQRTRSPEWQQQREELCRVR